MAVMTMVQAINAALREEMARDDRVVVFGQDVAKNGGVFRATDGLLDRFGAERVVDTPLSEAAIVGSAIGLAVAGMVPVAHPGWVYSLRFTPDGKYVISGGPAPQNRGFLAAWAVADGKLTYGEELPVGAIHSLALSPDGKLIGLACGPQGKVFNEVNSFVIKMPDAVK